MPSRHLSNLCSIVLVGLLPLVASYYELQRQEEASVEVAMFGLAAEYMG